MKPTFIDRLVGFLSPTAGLRRLQARQAQQFFLRGYDAAQSYNTSDWTSANTNSANAENKLAGTVLRERSRDLSRNNPYAVRALDVVVSNVVGAGIVANIKSATGGNVDKEKALWKAWAETTAIDADGLHDFYGLQALVMRSIVESGEILALKRDFPDSRKVQVLEADHLASDKDEGAIVQGIELDKTGRRVAYHLYPVHPGDKGATTKTYKLPATDVIHSFDKRRPGQQRGIPWNHSVIEKLQDIEDYQRATLIRQKVAACFGGFITTNGKDNALPAATVKEKRQASLTMEPATFKYLGDNESITLASPPGVDGYADFLRENLRAVASGYRISYEALTGDYSQVNFSSGRMGQMEFRKNVENWRWNMLIPQFCDVVWLWFCERNNIDPTKVIVEWVAPAHVQIDPAKEGTALMREVRNGFKTFGEAVRELGKDPDALLQEYAEWNQKIDKLGLALDSDPRRMSQIGFAQAGDALGKLSPGVPSLQNKYNPDQEEGQESEVNTSANEN